MNGLLHQFLTELKFGAAEIGYNAFSTAKMKEVTLDWGKDSQRLVWKVEGRSELTDGYFDFIFRVSKDEIKKKKGTVNKYRIKSLKNRSGKSFNIINRGATELWKTVMELKREQDGEET
jgi:hypothetical protein